MPKSREASGSRRESVSHESYVEVCARGKPKEHNGFLGISHDDQMPRFCPTVPPLATPSLIQSAGDRRPPNVLLTRSGLEIRLVI